MMMSANILLIITIKENDNMKEAKKLLSLVLSLIFIMAMAAPAFAAPQYSPYVDRNAVIGSDFSVTWDKVEPTDKYDMCIYTLNSGIPTYVNFNAVDIVDSGSQYRIDGKFLKDAVKEKATKDNLSGKVKFALRINEVDSGNNEKIDYSYFVADLSAMTIIENSYTEIKEVNIIFDLTSDTDRVTTNTPHVKISSVVNYDDGKPLSSISKPGNYKIQIAITADEGYAFDSAVTIKTTGQSVDITNISTWEAIANIQANIKLEEDEIIESKPSFMQRMLDAIRNFFNSISLFFSRIFGIGGPV